MRAWNPTVSVPEPATGRLDGATGHYRKHLRDLDGLYRDRAAFAALLIGHGNEVVYEVFEHRQSHATGDLIFGTTVMQPGQVGAEYFMTRGHRHAKVDRAEIYHGLAGEGLLLVEGPEGEVRALELAPGRVAYVPPHWLHRSVNTGTEPFVTLFCYPADSGHDYGVIERAGGMRQLVVADGPGGWRLAPNPGWHRRDA